MNKLFSIILPIYKNEKNIPITIPYIIEKLDLLQRYNIEIIMVNDGSPDNSWDIMREYQKNYPDLIRIVKLTRNFGQGAAQRCGIDIAKGDVVGIYTADMQDPFELFADMLVEWENGYKFVLAERNDREEKGFIAWGAKQYNKMVNRYISHRYPKGGFDFYIVDRSVIDEYKKMDFNYPFGQMQLIWLGYEYKKIAYVRKKRELGKSGYKFWKKFELVLKTFITKSDLLFNIMMAMGVIMFMGGTLLGIVDLILLVTGVINLNIVIDVLFILAVFCGTIQISMSIIGKYVWYTMTYTKNDPCYVIDKIIEGD